MKEPYYDPAFKQYVLDAVASAPPFVYARLEEKDKAVLKRINSASLQECLILLGKLNKRYMIVVADRNKVRDKPVNWKAVVRWFRHRMFKMAGPALKDWGIFVRADAELMQRMAMLSVGINARTLFLLRNHEEIAAGIANLDEITTKRVVQDQSQDLVDNLLCKTFATYIRFKRNSSEVQRFGITAEQLPILFFMSTQRDRLVSIEECAVYLAQYNKTQDMKIQLTRLAEAGHLIQHPGRNIQDPPLFQLSGFGVNTVNTLRNLITYHT